MPSYWTLAKCLLIFLVQDCPDHRQTEGEDPGAVRLHQLVRAEHHLRTSLPPTVPRCKSGSDPYYKAMAVEKLVINIGIGVVYWVALLVASIVEKRDDYLSCHYS